MSGVLQPVVKKLSGSVKYTRLLSGVPETKGMRCGFVVLQACEEVGEHSTEAKEETLVFLEGVAEVRCENHPAIIISVPSVVYIPPHTKHNVVNLEDALVKYVFIVSPVGV